MSWKQSLDRYLTTPPDDGFGSWCEQVIEAFTNDFFDTHEDWILDRHPNAQCNIWLCKLMGKDPKIAAAIIERAFNIYIKN